MEKLSVNGIEYQIIKLLGKLFHKPVEHFICFFINIGEVSNMESLNAVFINEGLSQRERLEKLNKIAIQQMQVLENVEDKKLLTDKN